MKTPSFGQPKPSFDDSNDRLVLDENLMTKPF